MNNRKKIGQLDVAIELADFINEELLPKIERDEKQFWMGFETIIKEFSPRNAGLLSEREELQSKIDAWHKENLDQGHDAASYKQFLTEIGYLEEEPEDFEITTANVDKEIARQAGPQLVVPVKNARFALNAVNARWGSFYDALYGTDVISEADGAERAGGYNERRGARVIDFAKSFLDQTCPLAEGSHKEATGYFVEGGALKISLGLVITELNDGTKFQGYEVEGEQLKRVLLLNHDLHIEIQFDRNTPVGSADPAGIADVILEAAVTTIQDCEDSVAAVDAEDKVEIYRNWLGLINGDLSDTFIKDGNLKTRVLRRDKEFISPSGENFSLPGRSMLLVRNVGHLMQNSAIKHDGAEIYEGILDAVVTSAVAVLDVEDRNVLSNSRKGSVYIVKPKMHGPGEVKFTCDLFEAVEKLLGLTRNTLKVGIMDEERRTTLNLKACIKAASERVVFINTGFLDRTGDEIHTSMEAGPMISKTKMKASKWISAYEDNNVDVGLACGLQGKAQIGKGMWAMPDLMEAMVEQKINHPESGANTAWVPSPTAAVLHAMHYHRIKVFVQQDKIKTRAEASIDEILKIPVLEDRASLTSEEIQKELDNNAQGILGYVVRWIDQGIGCSKVPDINDIGLMEDRATLRISSQHIANWLHHGICSKEQVQATMERMAGVVDDQNKGDPLYTAMTDHLESSIAFKAACELVYDGLNQPSGYTEPILHARRLEKKGEL